MAITNSEEVVSILATYGLNPGHVALLGYEPKEKIAFLGHFDGGTDIENSVYRLHLELFYLKQLEERKPEERKHAYCVNIIGDDEEVSKLKEAIENFEGFEHALCMVLDKKQRYETDAVSIDARGGKINPRPPPEYGSLVQEKTYKPGTPADIVYRP